MIESKKTLNKVRENVLKYWKELHEFRKKDDTTKNKQIVTANEKFASQ